MLCRLSCTELGQAWPLKPGILTLGVLRREDRVEFQANLGYGVKFCLNKNKNLKQTDTCCACSEGVCTLLLLQIVWIFHRLKWICAVSIVFFKTSENLWPSEMFQEFKPSQRPYHLKAYFHHTSQLYWLDGCAAVVHMWHQRTRVGSFSSPDEPGDWTQVLRLDGKHVYLLNLLTSSADFYLTFKL